MLQTKFIRARGYGGATLRHPFSWFTVDDGVISSIGTDDKPPPESNETFDLSEKIVLPGFVDSHTHLSQSAWIPATLDAAQWSNKRQALDAIETRACAQPDKPWILGVLAEFANWRGGLASPDELDEASGGIAVLIADITMHRGLISNSGIRRLNLLGKSAGNEDVDRRRGRPTGMIWEEVFAASFHAVLSEFAQEIGEKGVDALFLEEARRHLSYGITACHDPCIPSTLVPSMERLSARTPLRISWSSVSNEGLFTSIDAAEVCPSCGDGPRSAKLFMDGAHRCAMCLSPSHVLKMAVAACTAAFRGDIGPITDVMKYRTVYRNGGYLSPYHRMEADELTTKLNALGDHGIRARIHALGNFAASCTCKALLDSGLKNACIEHLMALTDSEIELVAKSGAVASVQPGFMPHYGPSLLNRGMTAEMKVMPALSLLRAGVPLALSSDNPCGPLDPIHNIRSAVNRTLDDGRAISPGETLDIIDACQAYSTGGEQAISGVAGPGLAVGAPADFIVMNALPDKPNAEVQQTWVGGACAYSASEFR